jgi:hypothetical protein
MSDGETILLPRLWVPCDRCGAGVWDLCRNMTSGKEVTYIHRPRQLARAA